MELSLYTDSVADLPIGQALELVEDAGRRREFAARLSSRGLRLAAVNCSAWPMHPRHGARHEEIMRAAVRLAGQLGVIKIVTMSGCPGDAPDAGNVNWVFYPWPPEDVVLRERQWDQAANFWEGSAGFAAGHGIERIALELHPLHLAYNVPTLLRLRAAVGPIVGANVDPSHMFWQRMDPAHGAGQGARACRPPRPPQGRRLRRVPARPGRGARQPAVRPAGRAGLDLPHPRQRARPGVLGRVPGRSGPGGL